MESLAAGLDLEMPGPQVRRVAAVMTAVREGQLDEAVLGPLFAQIQSKTQALFGGGEQAAIGLDMMEMLGDMPVVSVLMFQQDALTMPADEIVTGLLRQVQRMNWPQRPEKAKGLGAGARRLPRDPLLSR